MDKSSAQHTTLEQKILKMSIASTVMVSVLGVVFGLLSGSEAILFDGAFSSIDAAMSMLALGVSRLIMRETTRRFHFGFWHLEPMTAALNGAILVILCSYACINAINTLLQGGSEPELGLSLIYAVIVCCVCFGMYFVEKQWNKKAQSEFVHIDIVNWLMAGLITTALLIAFIATYFMHGTKIDSWIPYVDASLVMILTICFMPLPARIVYRSMREVLMVAPKGITREVNQVLSQLIQREGLLDYECYISKSGRVHSIEIHLVTPPDFAVNEGVAKLDRIREEIAGQLSIPAESRWFTVSFTANPRWT